MNRVLQQRLNQISRNNNFLFSRHEQQQAGQSAHTAVAGERPRTEAHPHQRPVTPQYR